ncbi:MAG: twin-arginine translocase TatA/TatE family subunit [Verrucomicrobia bacterium]|nr:twin-arginine translocase TatA/TatE family subunit [Verrucomicrobiota bacterium]
MYISSPLIAGLVPGGWELVVILFIILLLFGGAKLPQLAKGLGQSIKEFKKAAKEDDEPTKPEAKAATEAKKPESSATHGSN